MNARQKRNKGKSLSNKIYMREAHEDLQESKKLVRDLLKMRRELYQGKKKNQEEIEEVREKAIDAINNLFSDEVGEEEA